MQQSASLVTSCYSIICILDIFSSSGSPASYRDCTPAARRSHATCSRRRPAAIDRVERYTERDCRLVGGKCGYRVTSALTSESILRLHHDACSYNRRLTAHSSDLDFGSRRADFRRERFVRCAARRPPRSFIAPSINPKDLTPSTDIAKPESNPKAYGNNPSIQHAKQHVQTISAKHGKNPMAAFSALGPVAPNAVNSSLN